MRQQVWVGRFGATHQPARHGGGYAKQHGMLQEAPAVDATSEAILRDGLELFGVARVRHGAMRPSPGRRLTMK